MQKRKILTLFIIATLIISIFIGFKISKNRWHFSIPQFKDPSFSLPITAQYIPVDTDISFHWKINPKYLPEYLAKSGKLNKNQELNEKEIASLRDLFFTLIGIDFQKQIENKHGTHI